MKKIYLLITALAAMTAAQAQTYESATLEVGDYEGATTVVEGSYWDSAPTTFYLAHTGSQIIYTAKDLADLDELTDVKIDKITYRFLNAEGYETIVRDVKLYLQEIDETAFAVIDGTKQFFDFDAESPALDVTAEYPLYETYGNDGEVEFDLSAAPFAHTPGKGLLVTVVMDAQDNDNCLSSGFDLQFYNAGIRHRAMTFTNNTVSFLDYYETDDFPKATSMLGCGTDIDLPVTKFDFTYQVTPETGISEVSAARAADGAYYNLMGRRMNADDLPAGIYIHNGKKIVKQ